MSTADKSPNTPPDTSPNPPASQPRRSKRKIFIIAGVLALLLVSTAAAYYWWSNRQIDPVTLNTAEQQVLDNKIETAQERTYQAGGKILVLTEREVNALFHHNTGLGDKVRFELANNAIHARIQTDLDQDLPLVGGRTLKAKARFKLTDTDNRPAIILDDLTVWGISLPNAWLADLKGKNLITNLGIDTKNHRISQGIDDITVDNGKITIHIAD